VLDGLLDAHTLTYASGLTAAYAALLHYSPSVIAIRRGYHGVHAAIKIFERAHDLRVIDLDDEYPQSLGAARGNGSQTPKGGLLVWVESPLNPTGEARDLAAYAKRAHQAGGVMAVDSTFAPLQDVFGCGADMAMHSATKYFGGHSDLLMGILATKDRQQWNELFDDRCHFGGQPGNMEAWLLLRSLRTLQVRWRQQSTTATQLAQWLQSLVAESASKSIANEDQAIVEAGLVQRVWHASFQPRTDVDPSKTPRFEEGKSFDPTAQMHAGWPATFAFRLRGKKEAALLPHKTVYFAAATSLGGVESLLEHRLGSDPSEDPALVRISVGLEDFVDLQADLRSAFEQIL
jgi:cystathionine beta-lyase/cystathionine gamma-synthase